MSETGCRRKDTCEFSHDTRVCGDGKSLAIESFKCVGCKCEYKEERFVVKHLIKDTEIFFCLNCEDWVKEKQNVLEPGWSLFDEDGNLNHLV